MIKTHSDRHGVSSTRADESEDAERQSSRELNVDAAANELPMCPNRMIVAVDAVRGTGFALQLLREHLHLRASARLVFSSYSGCFFLELDDFDRFKNPRVGMLEAVSTMPFRSSDIFKQEMSTWTASDIAGVEDPEGIKALTELRVISAVL